ncbi:MAG: aminotransferase class IV [Deltaproteobacteria bacterium]|nr:aminotransferase class IV [Deltaproteobacteria bacterium]
MNEVEKGLIKSDLNRSSLNINGLSRDSLNSASLNRDSLNSAGLSRDSLNGAGLNRDGPSPIFTEAIKQLDGRAYCLNLHLERMNRASQEFYGRKIDFDLMDVVSSYSKQFPKGLFKIRLVYGRSLIETECQPYKAKKIKTVELAPADCLDYGHKYLDRRELNELKRNSSADEIIVIQKGQVTDSSIANLVFENEKGLFTPKNSLLKGVKREKLLHEGTIVEKVIEVSNIAEYKTIRFINAMIDLEDGIETSVRNIVNPR